MHVRSAWKAAGEIWLQFLEGMGVKFVRRPSKSTQAGEVLHSLLCLS